MLIREKVASKLERNWRVIKIEWFLTLVAMSLDWKKGTLHSRTAGIHAAFIEGMPRLWFYKFWPQWVWIAYMVNEVYFSG